MTISELSAYLNIKKATLYSWVEQNKIPHLKIQGLVRFDQAEVDAWLQSLRPLRPRGGKQRPSPGFRIGKELDVDEMVARARSSVYNDPHGETGPDSCPGKGGEDGAL
ncbi:MAG: helix-turn-helix domain-containing protein [Nitrospirae bacterium]|nr:helix-turn-helix domain-containing protein [Nitrospirota bacterium]